MSQFRRWCFTLNNPVLFIDYYKLIKDTSDVRRFVYGVEVGESGTRHLQGYIEFTKAKRIGPLKIMFPTAHWESAKGSYKQNYKYCTKENNSVESGDWTGAANVIAKKENKKDIIRRILDGDREAKCLNGYLNNKRSIDSVVAEFRYDREKRRRYTVDKDCKLRPWQEKIFKALMSQKDRKITWVYDAKGSKGKTWFSNYLRSVYNFDVLNGTTATKDVVSLLSEEITGICFDVTRDDATHFSYQTLEHAKNGYMITGKYEGIKRLFKICPVIVFANFEPIRSSLSEDRWDIHILEDGPFQNPEELQATYDPKEEYPPPPQKDDPLEEKDVIQHDKSEIR